MPEQRSFSFRDQWSDLFFFFWTIIDQDVADAKLMHSIPLQVSFGPVDQIFQKKTQFFRGRSILPKYKDLPIKIGMIWRQFVFIYCTFVRKTRANVFAVKQCILVLVFVPGLMIFKIVWQDFSGQHIWPTFRLKEVYLLKVMRQCQDLWLSRDGFCAGQRKPLSLLVNSTRVSELQRTPADCTLLRRVSSSLHHYRQCHYNHNHHYQKSLFGWGMR